MANGAAFPPSGKLEEQMEQQLSAAVPGDHEIVVGGSPGDKIRSKYLRWFILQAIPAAGLAITRFELCDAKITGELDLRGSTVGVLLRFVDCTFPKTIRLTDAKIIGIDFIAGEIEAISGDRLTAEGSVRILAPKFVGKKAPDNATPEQIEKADTGTRVKQLRLCGASIRGNLDLRGSRLGGFIDREPVSPSLFADGITVKGNVLLSKGFVATGEICLNGSTIARNLDCSAATLINRDGYSLSAAGAQISGSVLLCRPYWRDKDDDDHDVERIFRSVGTVRLEGAKISGDLNCRASRFTAAAFLNNQRQSEKPDDDDDLYAIKADGLDVGADLIFGSDSDARASVIHSDIPNAESVISGADGIRYDILGTVSLINARVGGDLLLCDSRLHFPGEETFCADGITVAGSTFLDNSYSNGVIRFVQATLKQGLSIRGAKFDVTQGSHHWLSDENISETVLEGPACGIYASFAQIGGNFAWRDVEKISQEKNKIRFWLDLSGAVGSAVEDDEKSWVALDRFDVTGTLYASISNLNGAECKWRLRELDRQYTPLNQRYSPDLIVGGKSTLKSIKRLAQLLFNCRANAQTAVSAKHLVPKTFESLAQRDAFYVKHDRELLEALEAREKTLEAAVRRFKPQPYLHLAKTFRVAGYQAAMRDVLVRLERNQTRYSDISLIVMLWRWLLDLTIEYGHALLRPIIILAVWIVVSAVVFEISFDNHEIVRFKDTTKEDAVSAAGQARAVPAFNSLIFAIDTLLPIVDLNQKKNWTVNPLSSAGEHQPLASMSGQQAFAWVWRQIPEFGAAALLIFNTFFGWLMTTLFVAGVSGLMRTGKDG